MKSVSTIIIVLLVVFTHKTSAQIVVYDQRYQVEKMPQPKSFTFYNTLAIPSETITTTGGNISYQHNYHRFTANPISIANREGLNVSVGFGYATDNLSLNSPNIKNNNKAVWMQLFTAGNIKKNYYWRGIYAVGSYSNNWLLKNTSTYKHTLLVQVGRKWSSNLATSIGVLSLSNFDDPQFIPTLHVSYSSGSWVVDALLPNDVSIRYLLNEKLHILLTNTLIRRSYYNPVILLSNKFTINELGVHVEYKIIGVLWGELGFSKPYGLKMETQKRNTYSELGEISQNFSLNGGLFIRFQEVY